MILIYLLAIAAGCFMMLVGLAHKLRAENTKQKIKGLGFTVIGILLISISFGSCCKSCTDDSSYHGDDYFDTWTGKPKNPYPFGYPVY